MRGTGCRLFPPINKKMYQIWLILLKRIIFYQQKSILHKITLVLGVCVNIIYTLYTFKAPGAYAILSSKIHSAIPPCRINQISKKKI